MQQKRPTYREPMTNRETELLAMLRPLELHVLDAIEQIRVLLGEQHRYVDHNAFSPAADTARRARTEHSNAGQWLNRARASFESGFMFAKRAIEQPLPTDVIDGPADESR